MEMTVRTRILFSLLVLDVLVVCVQSKAINDENTKDEESRILNFDFPDKDIKTLGQYIARISIIFALIVLQRELGLAFLDVLKIDQEGEGSTKPVSETPSRKSDDELYQSSYSCLTCRDFYVEDQRSLRKEESIIWHWFKRDRYQNHRYLLCSTTIISGEDICFPRQIKACENLSGNLQPEPYNGVFFDLTRLKACKLILTTTCALRRSVRFLEAECYKRVDECMYKE
ncbi:hypothetical protein SK128_009201 [Halocaridina rubra]|uniref:Uncharacterized protein n=1 Tax=Halocaridina rubra TaxID=373956 RepID=A0AAN8WAQ0_HALRR